MRRRIWGDGGNSDEEAVTTNKMMREMRAIKVINVFEELYFVFCLGILQLFSLAAVVLLSG